MHAIAHGGVWTHVRESALKVGSGKKIPCRTGESNLRQRRAGPTLYQLNCIPAGAAVGECVDGEGEGKSGRDMFVASICFISLIRDIFVFLSDSGAESPRGSRQHD